MDEPGLPLHYRIDYYSRCGLRTPPHIEVKYQKRRGIELLVYSKRSIGPTPALPRPHQAKVVAFGHLNSQSRLIGIGPRAFDQKGFASVVGDDRYALLERADVDIPSSAFDFINRASEPAPSQLRYGLAVYKENVSNAAVTDALNDHFARAHEVVLEDLAGNGY